MFLNLFGYGFKLKSSLNITLIEICLYQFVGESIKQLSFIYQYHNLASRKVQYCTSRVAKALY